MKSALGSILIEVLLTIVILSISLTVIIQSLLSSLRAIAYSSQYTQALMVVDSKMFEVMEDFYTPDNFFAEGNLPVPYEDYKYVLTAEDRGAEMTLSEVKLEASWPSGSNRKTLAVETYLMKDSVKETQ